MRENICKLSTRKKFMFKVYKEIIHTMSKEQITQLKYGLKNWIDSFPRRHTNGQQVPETVLNITNQHRNVDQNHSDFLILVTMATIKKTDIISVSKNVEKREHFNTVCGNVNCNRYYGKHHESFSKKLKIELSYNPAILLLGIYPKKIKTLIWKDKCTLMFIAALFINI